MLVSMYFNHLVTKLSEQFLKALRSVGLNDVLCTSYD